MRSATLSETRQRILELIKRKGPHDATALAGRLGISPMGVRQHLYALEREGLVEFEERSGAIGRPAKQWRLTLAANRLFPDAHPELLDEILAASRKAFGEKGVARVLAERTRAQLKDYRRRMPPGPDLDVRIAALARVRREEGYMAESKKQPDGSFVLIENHCSIVRRPAAAAPVDITGRRRHGSPRGAGRPRLFRLSVTGAT